MHRIDTSTAQIDKFGAGKNGFTNGDPTTGRRSTDLNSDMWDAVQEEICTVIEESGLALNKEQHDQLYRAIVKLIAGQIPDALLRKNNLSDVIDKAIALDNIGGVPKTRKINGYDLSKDITLKPKDVGSLPLVLVNLSVDLNTLGAQSNAGIYQQQANANATTANHYPVNQAGSLFVTPSAYGCQQLYITYGSRIFVRALNGNFNGSGPWTEWLEIFSTNGGILTGNVTISKSAPTLVLKSTDNDTRQYILGQKKDGAGSSWYVGKANANSESLMLWNYVSNSGIEIDGTGRILLKRNGKDIIFQPDSTISGEIIGNNANNFRIAYGNYGTFWRNDGGNLYLMLTNSGDPLGSYNSLRPFFVNLATGYVTMGRLGLSDYTNFDARYYTQSAANARFVTQVRLGSVNTTGQIGNSNYSFSNGMVMTGLYGSANYTVNLSLHYRAIQYLINGTWYTAVSA